MIPFFVADRPMSLRLLKGLPLQDYPDVRIGIMAHANTTLNFQRRFRDYPCDALEHCDAAGTPCQYMDNARRCEIRQHVLKHTIKMCDSGIFTREGATLTYDQLFDAYARMGVEYGVMIDVFRDAEATLKSGKEALEVYEPFKDTFKLVGVAHGGSVGEYLDCYVRLRDMGFSCVAVGGLLRRQKNTVRFTSVQSEAFMVQVLGELRRQYPADWLFALGCFHPGRLLGLKELNVWADYKGWIFQYKKRNETLDTYLEVLASNHLEHLDKQESVAGVSSLQRIIALRNNVVARRADLSKELFDGRRTLRALLGSVYQELRQELPDLALRFKSLTTHGLLDSGERKLVSDALQRLGEQTSQDAGRILQNIRTNRELNQRLKRADERIDQANSLLARRINGLAAEGTEIPSGMKDLCSTIVCLIERTEREHRFHQVRDKIAKEILALL
jgi:hypothetical protein